MLERCVEVFAFSLRVGIILFFSVCVCVGFLVGVGSSKSGQLPVKCAFRLMQGRHFGSFGSGSCSELSDSESRQLLKSDPIPTLFSLAF